jgi:hypothetical protein
LARLPNVFGGLQEQRPRAFVPNSWFGHRPIPAQRFRLTDNAIDLLTD